MQNHNHLASALVQLSVDDLRELQSDGLAHGTSPNLAPLVFNVANRIAFKHRLKRFDYTKQKLWILEIPNRKDVSYPLVLRRCREARRLSKIPAKISRMDLEDADSVFAFFKSKAFISLCEMLKLDPRAVLDRLNRTGADSRKATSKHPQ